VRIEQLEVKNFRCLEDITINFPDNNIAVIVGINGAGKTTILDGLKIVLSSIINQLIQLEIKKDFVLQDIIGSLTIWTVRSSRKINEFTRVSAPNVLHPSSRLTIAERLSMQGF